jgi:hypothetical protein
MRRIETADVVRVEEDRLYAANEGHGLAVYDLGDVDWPRNLGVMALEGDPIGIFVRGPIAVAALTDVDVPERGIGSRLVAVDARDPNRPVVQSTVTLPGGIRDIHAVDDTFYVLSDDSSSSGPSTVLTSFALERGKLRRAGELRLSGRDPSFVVGSTKIAVTFNAADASGQAGARILVLDIGADPTGGFVPASEVRVRGAVASRTEPSLDAEERFLRVITCGTRACFAHEALLLSSIDIGNPYAARPISEVGMPELGGSLVASFDGDRLYVAGDRGFDHGDVTTPVRAVDLQDPAHPVIGKPVVVRGSVAAFLRENDRVMTLGYRTASPESMRVQVHELDLENPAWPRLLGSVEFGESLTSTVASNAPWTSAVDERGRWMALPFSSWNDRSKSHLNGVEVVSRGQRGLRRGPALFTQGWVAHALFVKDRLVAVSDAGLTVVALDEVGNPRVTWPRSRFEGLLPRE